MSPGLRAALIAFYIGGVTTGVTVMWQEADDGVMQGIVMRFLPSDEVRKASGSR